MSDTSPPKPPRPTPLPSVPDIKSRAALMPPPQSHTSSPPILSELNIPETTAKVVTYKNRLSLKSEIGIAATMITSISALIASLATWQRAPQEPVAKLGYEVLQQAYLSTQNEIKDLRKSQEDQTKAFQAYVKAKEGEDNVSIEPDVPNQVMPALRVQVQPSRKLVPLIRRNGTIAPTSPPEMKEIVLPSTKSVTISKSIPDFASLQDKSQD
jgi:hypothetical protein